MSTLHLECGWRSVGVHLLVATAFIENPNNSKEVHHKDFDRQNPRVDNLEWISHADNVRKSICNKPNINGINNPNYGNRILSQRYKEDKELARKKQSRPALQNGRCRKIDLYYDGEYIKTFDYIVECCQYLIDNNYTKSIVESIRGKINVSCRENKIYLGHFTFEKK